MYSMPGFQLAIVDYKGAFLIFFLEVQALVFRPELSIRRAMRGKMILIVFV